MSGLAQLKFVNKNYGLTSLDKKLHVGFRFIYSLQFFLKNNLFSFYFMCIGIRSSGTEVINSCERPCGC